MLGAAAGDAVEPEASTRAPFPLYPTPNAVPVAEEPPAQSADVAAESSEAAMARAREVAPRWVLALARTQPSVLALE